MAQQTVKVPAPLRYRIVQVGIAVIAVTAAYAVFTTPASDDQGCVNQGSDRRIAALPTCWAQRHLSWKSDREPHFLLIGKPHGSNLGLAWPPYLVMNWRVGPSEWRMFRVGFRYDRNWRGYIFPTIASKIVENPLRY